MFHIICQTPVTYNSWMEDIWRIYFVWRIYFHSLSKLSRIYQGSKHLSKYSLAKPYNHYLQLFRSLCHIIQLFFKRSVKTIKMHLRQSCPSLNVSKHWSNTPANWSIFLSVSRRSCDFPNILCCLLIISEFVNLRQTCFKHIPDSAKAFLLSIFFLQNDMHDNMIWTKHWLE